MSNKNHIIVCDLDNCLFDDSHRLDTILSEGAANRYDNYHAHAHLDPVNVPLHRFLKGWESFRLNFKVVFCTARPEWMREKTRKKLLELDFCDPQILMRPEGDAAPSSQLKLRLLQEERLHGVCAIFDDREDVLKALSGYGAPTMQIKASDPRDWELCMKKMIEDEEPFFFMKAAQKLADIGGLNLPAELATELVENRHRIKFIQKFEPKQPEQAPAADNIGQVVAQLLEAGAATFRERNASYGSNFRMVGPIMQILFPAGVPPELLRHDAFHLFELIIVKLSRFAISRFTHQDSIHDAAVYAAMIEAIIQEIQQNADQ